MHHPISFQNLCKELNTQHLAMLKNTNFPVVVLSLYSLSLFLLVVLFKVKHFGWLAIRVAPKSLSTGVVWAPTRMIVWKTPWTYCINTSTWTVHLEKLGETSASHWGSKYVGPHIQIAQHVPNSTFHNKPQRWPNFRSSCTSPSACHAFIQCVQPFRGTGPHLLRARGPLGFRRPGKCEVTQTNKCVECLENMVGFRADAKENGVKFYGCRKNKVALPWSEIKNPVTLCKRWLATTKT